MVLCVCVCRGWFCVCVCVGDGFVCVCRGWFCVCRGWFCVCVCSGWFCVCVCVCRGWFCVCVCVNVGKEVYACGGRGLCVYIHPSPERNVFITTNLRKLCFPCFCLSLSVPSKAELPHVGPGWPGSFYWNALCWMEVLGNAD